MQIAGLLARRVLCYANVGDRLEAGQRYGFIRFGSRADLYLPETFHPTVSLGDKVAAGMNCLRGNNEIFPKKPRHAIYALPNAFTTAALFAGFYSICAPSPAIGKAPPSGF